MKLYGVENAEQYLPEGFIDDVERAAFLGHWKTLLDQAFPAEIYMIRRWHIENPSKDILSASGLFGIFREIYSSMPQGSRQQDYLRNIAGETSINIDTIRSMLCAQKRLCSCRELPPIKGITNNDE